LNIVLNEPLSQISLLFVSAAMGLLAVALLMFAFQLARLKDDPTESRFERYGFWVLGAGTVVLGVGVFLRGVAAQRVPWANMYEFAISGALMILTIYLSRSGSKTCATLQPLSPGSRSLLSSPRSACSMSRSRP